MAGDKTALDSWNEFGFHMGNAIKTVVYTYDPEAVVLGGSLVKAYHLFVDAMTRSRLDFAFPESMKKLKIFVSQDSNIALLGAASLL
jgi:glucokinase